MRPYSRFFITLRQDDKGYGFHGKQPFGRCIIEVTGGQSARASFFVQDLRPQQHYKAVLVHIKRSDLRTQEKPAKFVQLGKMFADERGRCEFRCEFDPTNVHSSGLSVTDFQIACLMVETNENKIEVPLVGFKDAFAKDYGIDWKSAGFDTVEEKAVEVGVISEVKSEVISEVRTDIPDVIITEEEKEELYKTESEIKTEPEITYFTVDINAANVIYDADDDFKVSMKELIAHEYGLFDVVNDPTVLYNYYKHGFFKFSHHGADGKRLGLPSNYNEEDAEHLRGLGFDRFTHDFSEHNSVHNEKNIPKSGDFGYWMKEMK
jgi:hypothetical protein